MRFYFIERLEKYNLSFILIHVFQIFLNLIFYLSFQN